MKKVISIFMVLLIMGCGVFTNIKVLEVKAVDDKYIITYSKNVFIDGDYEIFKAEFETLLGVENFLDEVAHKDLSQWRQQ